MGAVRYFGRKAHEAKAPPLSQRRALWGKVEEGGGGWPKSRRVTKTQAGDEWAGGEWAGGE